MPAPAGLEVITVPPACLRLATTQVPGVPSLAVPSGSSRREGSVTPVPPAGSAPCTPAQPAAPAASTPGQAASLMLTDMPPLSLSLGTPAVPAYDAIPCQSVGSGRPLATQPGHSPWGPTSSGGWFPSVLSRHPFAALFATPVVQALFASPQRYPARQYPLWLSGRRVLLFLASHRSQLGPAHPPDASSRQKAASGGWSQRARVLSS